MTACAVMMVCWLAAEVVAAQTSPTPMRILHLGLIAPPDHGMALAADRIAAHVRIATNGAMAVRVHYSATRGNESSMLAQLGDRQLDSAILTLGELARHDDSLNAFFVPFLVPDVTVGGQLMATPAAHALAARVEQPLGLRVLGLGVLGMRHMVLARPPDAGPAPRLDGLRIRTTPNPAIVSFYESLGAQPHPLPLPVVRDALMRGIIEGADMDLEILLSRDFVGVAPHAVTSAHMMFPVAAVVSEATWSTLDEPARAVLTKAMSNEMAALAAYYAEREPIWRSQLTDLGMGFYRPQAAPLNAAVQQWWSKNAHLRPVANALLKEIGSVP
ncbi:MAG: hypothetical protein VR70_14670 [Rhodospirillaceae bacterium BRH_c57]|nr:MAG: hypothetical protein VR70_14670 [Rhodospirillaceae bacterium BRH_c57]